MFARGLPAPRYSLANGSRQLLTLVGPPGYQAHSPFGATTPPVQWHENATVARPAMPGARLIPPRGILSVRTRRSNRPRHDSSRASADWNARSRCSFTLRNLRR